MLSIPDREEPPAFIWKCQAYRAIGTEQRDQNRGAVVEEFNRIGRVVTDEDIGRLISLFQQTYPERVGMLCRHGLGNTLDLICQSKLAIRGCRLQFSPHQLP